MFGNIICSLNSSWSLLTKQKRGSVANYTSNACVKHCYLETVRKDCNCYDPSAITNSSADAYARRNNFAVPDACEITKVNDCMNKVAKKINEGESNCNGNCDQPCFEMAFVPRVTNSLWPNKAYFEAMINVWKNRVPGMHVDSKDDADSALAKLEVYFEDLNFKSITESPAIDVWDLLTSIGGIFGLYTGVCFLTALEYIQLCYKLLRGSK